MPGELTVRGQAEIRVMPDVASIAVEVSADGASHEAAFDAAAALATAVDGVLTGRGSAVARATTTALVVQPRMRWRKEEQVQAGWRAARSTVVEVTELDAVGDLFAQLAHTGARVRDLTWGLAPDNRAHDAVRAAAAKDARRRAAIYADGLGLRLGDVIWVAEPGLRSGRDDYARPATLLAERASFSEDDVQIAVDPAEIVVTAAVDVAFAFRPRPTD